MRVEFINKFGGRMYVDESRVEEYKGAGFKLASSSLEKKATTEETKPEKTEKKPVKKR